MAHPPAPGHVPPSSPVGDLETPPNRALSRRIKRHVIGRTHDFFVAASPGAEALCLDELCSLLPPDTAPRAVEGGATFTGRLTECYRANLHLRIAGRILLRLTTFRATNFRALEKKLSAFPWELYLLSGSPIHIRVTAKHSRLYHTGAVTDSIQRFVSQRLIGSGLPVSPEEGDPIPQTLHVRLIDDRCIISLDSSGEHLYRRGIKTHPGAAPIRETLAAAVLKLAGYDPGEPLMDPMCGSGTFSIEAAMQILHIPPGWFRPFAFMAWPGFQPGRWQHIRRMADPRAEPVAPCVFASDVDPPAVHRLNACITTHDFAKAVSTRTADFFQLNPDSLTRHKGLVVLNPPYGQRLGNPGQIQGLFSAIFEKLQAGYNGWKVALISPGGRFRTVCPFPTTEHSLIHGGSRRVLLTGKIN
jgi:putative N6-adenine-specific DNA methylase